MITVGIVAFSNLTQTESYNGQDTGKYSLVVTMEQEEADKLKKEGIKVKEYKNQPQRKFVTKFPNFDVVDNDGEVIGKTIPYGSKVKVMWKGGQPHPTHGVAPYFQKIKVLELAEQDEMEDDEDF